MTDCTHPMERRLYNWAGNPVIGVRLGTVICQACGAYVTDGIDPLARTDRSPEALALLGKAWGVLNFILAFYEPGQRYLDTEAWKNAEAGGRRVHAELRAFIDGVHPLEKWIEEDRDELREMLDDLWFCHSEQKAIGGGPGWKEREAKAWARVAAYFEP